MTDPMALVGDVISCVGMMSLFLFATEPRYSTRKTWGIAVAALAATTAAYLACVLSGAAPGQAALFTLSLPSLVLCLALSKHRDGRFLFTFCTVDVLGMIVIFFSRMLAQPFQEDGAAALVVNLLLMSGMLLLFRRYGGIYRGMMEKLENGWGTLSAVSISFYGMFYLLVGYPAPIVSRREYFPVAFFFCVVVLIVYTVIYQTVVRTMRLYESRQSEQLLQTRLELQRSQLELQQVYYRMAYVDYLTGLPNRASFEKRRREIEEGLPGALPVWCASADLNNLKEINDTRGHECGDRLLRETGELLRRTLDGAFEVFRVGGDEFLMLASGLPDGEAERRLREICPAVEEHNACGDLPIAVAVGWDSLRDGERGLDMLVLRADQEMYRRKREMKGLPCSGL